ncbi:MAG: LicD family protein [Bacteroidales bacterium]|nr:LicD family protein [Bacteroidales bacterium]
MAEYDIRPLQLRILDLLMQVDAVCRARNLRYYILAGTLLGAVRHKGFIPWDDDLDIGMPRADYDRLTAHAAEWLPAPLELVSAETDPSYPLPFAKIQDAGTTLIERLHLRYVGGIYIDVFPLDGMTACRLVRRLHFARYFLLKKIQYFLCRDPYRHGHGPSSWVPLLCRRFYTLEGVQRRMRRLQKAYDFDHSAWVVDHDDGLRGVMPRSVFGTPSPILFEGREVLGVADPDAYLTRKYGEYMVIPPAGQQRQHRFDVLDLDRPYRAYLPGDHPDAV